jgi:hypothetical protein
MNRVHRKNKRTEYCQRIISDRREPHFNRGQTGHDRKAMKEILSATVEDARKLGSFIFVCLAIVIWIGARACFAFFQEAIFHSLQEWLLSRDRLLQTRPVRFKYRVVAKREDITTAP